MKKVKLNNSKIVLLFVISAIVCSCKKQNEDSWTTDTTVTTVITTPTTDTTGTLKGAAIASSAFQNMGLAVLYSTASSNPSYLAVVKREANYVTFGNELKNGSIIRNDGTFDYSTADAFYTLCANNGLSVFGHTLCWYSQQNATYLNGLISAAGTPGSGATSGTNLLSNGNFEGGSGTTFTGWTNIVGGTAAGSFSSVVNDNDGGSRALQVSVTTPGANSYDMQSIGTSFSATSGKAYRVTLSIKSAAAGKVRLVMQNSDYQQTDIATTPGWATYTWNLTINEASPILRFNFTTAGTYIIDNISVVDPTTIQYTNPPAAATPAQAAAVIDNALNTYITTTVKHYAGKIKAWDVVNEPMSDGNGALRTPANFTITPANQNSQFLWSQYLGRNFALKAFQYAKAADPSALLFINEYNLEYGFKLDSLLSYVAQIKTQGAQIDGIGTQMHINLGTTYASIDNELSKLAKTGLMVRISELDVTMNSSKLASFTPDATALAAQAAMYKYVVQSYIKNVPTPQRFGITVWGLTDNESWLNTVAVPDFPLLFDKNKNKKQAYYSFLLGLKGQ